MATRFIDHLLEGDHASRPAFGAVPQGTLYACSDHALIYQSDGSTAWSTWATLGGSGGANEAPDTKPWNYSLPAAPEAENDEFNDDTDQSGPINGLDSKWSLHNLGTAGWRVLDDDAAPGCLALVIPTGQTADQAIYQPIPSFGDYVIEAGMAGEFEGGRQIWGIAILSTAGNGVSMSLDYTQSNGYRMETISSWGQTGSALVRAHLPMPGVFYHLWLRKSGSTYTGMAWPNGRGKHSAALATIEITHAPTAFTPAYIVFGRFYTAGGDGGVLLDYFRVTDET